VNTLFPEGRLKRTLEARACDCLPMWLVAAVPALFTGLLYDAKSLGLAHDLAMTLDYATVERSRPDLVRCGMAASIGDLPVRVLAERVYDIADAGLGRRARLDADGKDERTLLAPLGALLGRGRCPADVLLDGLTPGRDVQRSEIIRRTAI
jgi:glutamate--cysteine ligase